MKLLEGVRVLDLGWFIAGPFAALLLAELGADVIKVEWPGQGDKFRPDADGLYSPQFQAHNRNKRSLTLDYSRPEGRELFYTLVKTADVIVMNSRPGVAEKQGIGWTTLRSINPRLIYCSITGFGPDGPYAERPALDNVGQALSGWMSRHRSGDDPRVVGPAIADPVTSLYAALAISSALYERQQSGRGRLVEVNMLESMIGLGIEPLTTYFATGKPVPVYGRAGKSQAYNVTCRDGKRIGLHVSMMDKFWQRLCRIVDREDWISAYPRMGDRISNYEKLAMELNAIFAKRDRSEWLAVLDQADVPFAPENELQDLEADPQVQHLEVFYETEHPRHGRLKAPHRPAWVDGSRDVDFRPPPDLGEHTEEILREIGVAQEEVARLRGMKLI